MALDISHDGAGHADAEGSFAAAAAALRGGDSLLVLKFGSSVLRGLADLPRVAGEIYRQRRRGFVVVAVVSAMGDETDRLFEEAATAGGGTRCAGVADLVSLGEARTAALLRIACDRIGLPAEICQPEALGLTTVGGETGSRPAALDPANLRSGLARTGLVIVPGFVGIGADGGRALLGRGGSDFSAIYLGGELGAAAVRLYKDADGVFEADPARVPDARRYDEISWEDALQVARPLIQPDAVEYAAARRLPIEVEAIGSHRVSRVGPVTATPTAVAAERPLRVALAGYGVVGQAVARRLADEPRFDIVSVLVRDPGKPRAVRSPVPVTADPAALIASAPDIVVDALSCERAGAGLCGVLLNRGVHVASASKRMVAASGDLLAEGAQGGARLFHSAAVGGGATMLETVARVRRTSEITDTAIIGAWGVLNGTVNAILTAMARGIGFEAALAGAQAAGFAEEDPSADLSGADAAAKLGLIARAAWPGTAAPVIAVEPLDAVAAARIEASGERWVQIASVTYEGGLSRKGGTSRGQVALRPVSSLGDAAVPADEWNCLFIEAADASRTSCVGRGAGGAATAEAIVADLYDLASLPRRVAEVPAADTPVIDWSATRVPVPAC